MCARDEALRLGLTGWARNLPSREVELVAEGDPASIRTFEAWCRHGPPYALIENVAVFDGEATDEFDDFSIR